MSAWIETLEVDGGLRTRWDRAKGVYLIAPQSAPRVEWRRQAVESPWVDGEFETGSSVGRMTLPLRLEVRASSPDAAELAVQALIEDVLLTHSLQLRLVVGGVTRTYRAYRPNVDAPENYGTTGVRDVYMDFPVLPHPTITGTV